MTRWWSRLFGRRPPALDCHAVGEVLQHYLDGLDGHDGPIEPERAERIEAHLEVCRLCGLEAATYRRIKQSLAARRADVPPDAVARLRDFAAHLSEHGDGGLDPEAPPNG
ncbi:hypothetical protein BH24ACT5_BH24ACT5_25440 [soil metagenome]